MVEGPWEGVLGQPRNASRDAPGSRGLRAAGRVLAAAGCLLLLGGPPAPAQPRDEVAALGRELVYGGDAEFPPYEFLDRDGQPAGLNVDMVRAIARRERLQVRIELRPWGEIRAGVREGRIDFAAMYRSVRREREVSFAVAHELVYHEMFVARGGGLALRSLADLAGRKIAVQRETRGSEAVTDLEPAPEVVLVDSEPDALRALAAGQVEAALVSQAVGRPFVDREALASRIAVSGPPVLLTEYAFVTALGRPALLDRINQGVQAMKSSGEYDRLYDRWIRPDRSASPPGGWGPPPCSCSPSSPGTGRCGGGWRSRPRRCCASTRSARRRRPPSRSGTSRSSRPPGWRRSGGWRAGSPTTSTTSSRSS
jgi:ABC-type amino acid transport substrate-binding protein